MYCLLHRYNHYYIELTSMFFFQSYSLLIFIILHFKLRLMNPDIYFSDLSDFESENSPQKPSSISQPPAAGSGTIPSSKQSTAHPISTSTTITGNPAATETSPKDSNKPRIWSLADVAASKPSAVPSSAGPIHHQSSSVRHRPYTLPNGNNTSSFRPWFPPVGTPNAADSFAFRQLASQSAAFGNPLMPTGLPTTIAPALRIPLISSTPATSVSAQSTVITPSYQHGHTSLSTSSSPTGKKRQLLF